MAGSNVHMQTMLIIDSVPGKNEEHRPKRNAALVVVTGGMMNELKTRARASGLI